MHIHEGLKDIFYSNEAQPQTGEGRSKKNQKYETLNSKL
jgi:hypothetical protein